MNKTRIFKTAFMGVAGIIVTVAVVVSTPVLHGAKAYATATVSADELYKKALTVALRTCYSDTYMKKDNVSGNTTTVGGFLTSTGKSDGKIIVPTYVGNTLKDSDLSCEQVFDGYSGSGGYSKSIFAAFGKPRFSSSATGTNLVSLGYKPVVTENTAPTGNYKVKITFDYIEIVNGSASSPYTNRSYTITLDSNGEAIESNAASCYSEATDAWLCVSPIRGTFFTQDGQLFGNLMVRGAFDTQFLDMFNGVSITLFGTGEPSLVYGPATNCNGYVIDEENVAYSCGPNGKIRKFYNFKASLQFEEDSSQVTGSSKYEIQSFSAALATLRLYLGASSYNSFNNDDKKSLYYDNYILSVIKDSTSGTMYVDNNDCMASLTSEIQNSSSDYYLPSNGKWCRLVGSENATVKKNPADNDYKFAIISSSTSMKKTSGTKAAAFQEVVKELMKISNSIDITGTEDIAQEVNNATTPTDPGNNGGGSTDPGGGDAGLLDGCFSNAGVLGWILCPVLRLASTATNGIYDMIVENYLSIKSETVTSDALRDAWGTFQGYANILFAILLVIVILSQVTGVGISNYGIKKILPKLIITIILVNLSYIICSIAIDLSNIIGVSLNDLFGSAKVTVSGIGDLAASDLNIGTMVINSVEGIGLTGLTLVAGGAALPIVAEQWPNLILILFLAVISILISILFFFVLLVVRQAAVILLLVLAPVAVVCYALPNTQKMFDRWLKMFSAMLMVFPICGAVMGGCNYASRLLLSAGGNNGLLYYIIVMVLGVVPLFFIPSILKSSMSALGSIGTKLATSGERFSRWANRAVVGSQLYQDRKQEAQRNVNMARNKRIMDSTKLSDAEQTRLDSLRAKRASGAVLSNSERKELRSLGSRQYRYARAASARERGVMEDAMSDVASRREMLEHGSARYEKIVAGAMREQRNKDDAGQIALYEDGKVEAFDGSHRKIMGDSLADLRQEHLDLLKHVADNPEDEIAASKLRAVQTLLGRMGPNGFDAIEDNLGNLMGNHSQFSSANSKGLRVATSHLTRNFASQIKANSRTLDKMLTDFNSDKFSQQSTFSQQTFTDALGKTQTKYMSSFYGAQGAQSIKAENVNDLGDTYYDNLLRATINGDLKGQDLEQVLNVFNEAEVAAAAGKLTLKGEVKQRIQAIKNAAYASSALNGGVRSEGSRMIGTAGAAGIDSIVKQIESAGDWSTMSNIEKQQYSDLVNNITDSLKQDAHTVEDVRQLQQALATARSKNIETAVTGGTLINQVGTADLHSYKVPRGSKQKVAMPTGWSKTPGGQWIDMATGNPLNNADAAKAEKILEHNASIDVENGNV